MARTDKQVQKSERLLCLLICHMTYCHIQKYEMLLCLSDMSYDILQIFCIGYIQTFLGKFVKNGWLVSY